MQEFFFKRNKPHDIDRGVTHGIQEPELAGSIQVSSDEGISDIH